MKNQMKCEIEDKLKMNIEIGNRQFREVIEQEI